MSSARHRAPLLAGSGPTPWLCALGVALALTAGARANENPAKVHSLDGLLAGLRGLPGLSAHYREEKRITLLKQPLTSSGEIYFLPPAVFIRSTREPDPSVVIIDERALRVVDTGGERSVDAGAGSPLQQLMLGVRSVLAGDREKLERHYEAKFELRDGGGWRLTLKPRDPHLRKFLTQLAFEGKDLIVERLRWVEASGDSSTLFFSKVDIGVRFGAADRKRLSKLPGTSR
ncbi:MAG: outer membrane lipoprotein carrier protein LolA [Myxococcales bacterium]|nr:outer membrane lipoprotein carrier protein LolA [Myxococcales bacterium]